MSAGFESKTSCAFRTCVHCARLRFQIAWRRNIRSVLVVWGSLRERYKKRTWTSGCWQEIVRGHRLTFLIESENNLKST
jgi:hypothetical protein